jgi:ribokinase
MSVCVLGSINLDIVCRVAELPAPGETVSALSLARHAGGKGANQAVASARWGAATSLIGAVGRDDAADFLLNNLASAGVTLDAIAHLDGAPTGQAYINVSDAGENMIVVIGGANLEVTADQFGETDLAKHRVFLSQLETPVSAIEAFFRRGRGVRVLNAAPAALEARTLFPSADVLVVNETELARFSGVEGDIDGAARALISRPDQHVVVTLGAAGVRVVGAETIHAVQARPATVVDTTGAGDCFCGVMAAALSEGAALHEAVDFANAAAAVSTEHVGASAPVGLRQLTLMRHLA